MLFVYHLCIPLSSYLLWIHSVMPFVYFSRHATERK